MHARRSGAGAGSDGERARAAEARRAEQTKADQLVQHFYAKTCAVVSQARATHFADFDPPGTPLSPSAAAAAGSSSGGLAGVGGSSRSRRGSFSGRDKPRRTNKWFNLELPDNEQFRPELRTWRNVSRLLSTPSSTSSSFSSSSSSRPFPQSSPVPCMTLDVLLSTSDLTPNQALVLSNERGKRTRVSSPRTAAGGATGPSAYAGRASPASSGGALRSPLARAADASSAHPSAPPVVLERWTLALVPAERTGAGETELPTVYKRAIGHFRALYQLVRVLPAYALHRKLARRRGSGAGAAGAAGTSGGAGGGGGGGAGRSGGLGIEMRMRVGGAGEGAEGRAEIGLEDRLEEDGADEKETATIVFPGVATPSGTLLLSVAYRNNTDFSVEEIETLLSSRFIDEDFFRPTVARYASTTSAAHDEHARPGSLPISSSPLARGGSPALSGPGRGMTGLGPLPSYGSLSSRHQYAGPQATQQQHGPVAPSPLSLSPQQQQQEQSTAAPAPVPVPGASPSPSPRPSSYLARTGESASSSPLAGGSGSSRRYSSSLAGGPSSATAAPSTSATAHAAAGGGGGAAVEPAFISLSRARGNSFVSGGSGSGIQRVSPSPGSASSAIVRRTSITSSSGGGGGGGSPIFRPGSYLAHAAHASGSYTGGSPSGATTGAPASRQLVSGSPLATGGVFGSSGSYTSRGASYAYSRAGVGPPAGSSGGSGEVPWALGGPESGGSSVGAGVGVPALARRASGGAAATGTAASSRLSFGQAGSLGRASAAGPSRLGTMMRQYQEGGLGGGGPGGGGASGSPSTAASSSSSFGGADKKRFIHEGRAPDDADDINSFLSLLDSKPDLKALDASRLASSSSYAASGSAQQQQRGGAGGAGPGPRGSMVLNKRDVDEQLRLLRSSVFGGFPSSAGGGGESPSPPPLSLLTAGGGVSSSPRGGGGPAAAGGGGLSSLRRQTSRLSIEEDPVAEAAANARERASAARAGDGSAQLSSVAAVAATAGGYRSSLHAIASPPLSTAASPSAAVFAPTPSSSTSDAPQRQHRAYHRASGPEPRFLPLPVSSTTSPLASPGSRASHDPPPPAPQLAAPYPPLPYPPAATPTTSTSTEPVTIRGPSTYTYLSRAARQPVNPPAAAARGGFAGGGGGGGARGESVAASVASFETGGTGGTGTGASSLYRYDDDEGEGEAAGRLELDEDEGEGEDRQGRWGARRDENDDALAPSAAAVTAAAAGRLHSRDTTPAATRLSGGAGGGAGLASGAAPGGGYFAAARRAASASRASGGAGAGGSPPEIPWMG
ncbi:hypothetical protein Rhopal_003940-T1 [Rhodotorula paludigena]|uniref:Autophagy-related protein 13 n=1 Tax=Rhodotorula paludigena TaxID=86838 RepID=A0AAV5GN11_9BASI|nr:hypothetical protein Rhopal_003940-T1 [Rhodotorula paludigena]